MGEVALRFLQAGLESAKGTPTAATRILQARVASANFTIPREFPEDDLGSLPSANRHYDGVKDYGFTIEGETTYEQLPWFLATAVAGSVSPSTVNTTVGRSVYAPQTTAGGDDLQSATVEFGDDTQEFECEYCEVTRFTLGFDTLTPGQAAPLNASWEYITQSMTSNTKTASLTVPTVETILGTGGTINLGATSTAFGSLAALTGSLRSFSLNWDNALGRKVFIEDGKTYSLIGRGRRTITFDAIFEGNAAGVTRFVEWDNATEKRARILFKGTTVTGSSPATDKQLQLDFRYVATSFDPIGSEDTNTVFAISGRLLPDTALGAGDAEIEITLQNDILTAAT